MVLEIYGAYWGGLCLWASGIIGGIGGYWLARSFTSYFAGTRVEPYLAKMEDWLGTSEYKGLLIARFVPFIPYHAVNYAAGLLKVNLFRYMLTTAVGVFPHTVAMSAMYAGIRKGSLLGAVIGCILLIILAGLSWYVKKRSSVKSRESRVTAE
ncbi:putative membrane protein YdjX (TVP38/TMEM64 family) [Paenibacillus rhizosphaerae]|uniref:TVP38/TMEM64 family membrane protein n=2 Tax=Paenibacillus rhizosphaerae TaxID=297318 RepID=A0A839TN27_9BACL|nr:putative membrane protein YdjX (TVP38/TMEM64 family) [Paenibacillus rhizosphaerae]